MALATTGLTVFAAWPPATWTMRTSRRPPNDFPSTRPLRRKRFIIAASLSSSFRASRRHGLWLDGCHARTGAVRRIRRVGRRPCTRINRSNKRLISLGLHYCIRFQLNSLEYKGKMKRFVNSTQKSVRASTICVKTKMINKNRKKNV